MRRKQYRSQTLDVNAVPAAIAIILLGIDAALWAYNGHYWIAMGFGLAMGVPWLVTRWARQ